MTNSKQLLGQHSVLLITVALLLLQAPDLGTPIQQHNLESTTGESSSEPAGTTASAGDNHDDGRINGGGGGGHSRTAKKHKRRSRSTGHSKNKTLAQTVIAAAPIECSSSPLEATATVQCA